METQSRQKIEQEMVRLNREISSIVVVALARRIFMATLRRSWPINAKLASTRSRGKQGQ